MAGRKTKKILKRVGRELKRKEPSIVGKTIDKLLKQGVMVQKKVLKRNKN